MIIKFSQYGKSLGTRTLGKSIRNSVVEQINDGNSVVFDFDGVMTINNSFADEFLGKLLDTLNFKIIREKTEIINANDNIKFVIRQVLEPLI